MRALRLGSLFVLAALATACGSSTSASDDQADDTGDGSDATASDTGGTSGDAGKDGNLGGDTAASSDTRASTDTSGDTSTASDTTAASDTSTSADTDASTTTDTATASDTATTTDTTPPTDTSTSASIKTVFIIMMENTNWSSIKGSASAPYINTTLLEKYAHAENYKTPAGNHPSEPNYIWLEAGDNLGITDDGLPSANNQTTTSHLVTQLEAKSVTWKSYQEDIVAGSCPLGNVGEYQPKHNPMVFFDDVNGGLKTTSARCIAHVAPYTQLATDLASAATTPSYAFITPNLCNDMHGEAFTSKCGGSFLPDLIKMGDDWLKSEIPKIQASDAYKAGGVIFIIWDEGSGATADGPIGMIAVSPFAKVKYSGSIAYTHSSTLKTVETIFGVPFIRGAATSGVNDLRDLFVSFP